MSIITLLYPCSNFVISSSWKDHINRPGYNPLYAGADFAAKPQPLHPSQFNGKVLQSMMSSEGYGYTTFIEYSANDKPALRIRTAHQKDLGVDRGDIVNPTDSLGELDSTGNSTGNHVHFEVWLLINGKWQNIDPYDAKYGIVFVSSPSQLVPLGDDIPVPPPSIVIPTIPALPKVKTSPVVTSWLNLRELPFGSAKDIGDVKIGETWEVFGSSTDPLGNIWYAVKNGNKVGWSVAYWSKTDEIWLVSI